MGKEIITADGIHGGRPYGLAMDGVFNDRPQEGCFIGGNTIKPRSTKMTFTSDAAFRDRLERNAQQVLRKFGLATDTAVMDDEAAARIKEFLKGKLSAADHETLCNMIDGDSDAPDYVEGEPAMDGLSRERDRADFYARFPDAARIKIDTSGLPLRPRAPSRSDAAGSRADNGRSNDAAGTKSFYEMFPDAARIKLA